MKSINLKGKKISIIGAKRSGVACAEIALKYGGIPFVSDNGQNMDLNFRNKLEKLNVELEFGKHSEKIYDCDLMIISPGIDSNSALVKQALAQNIKVWPEIELAFQLCRGKIVGITGSNGKTTTTVLTGEIFRAAGIPTFVCGNIGSPFVAIADSIPVDGFAIVELSSFQLEIIDQFRPDIAVILNITPDHLDRHLTLENYAGAKMRIFENQTAEDFAAINYDDRILRECANLIKSKRIWFSTSEKIDTGILAQAGGGIYLKNEKLMNSNEVKIKGEHNLYNTAAAIAAADIAGISKEKIIAAIKTFSGVEHRLEPVRLIGGVSFINDSKGTNVDSVLWALKAISTPIILIAGGKDKSGDFSALNGLISERVRKVILIGQAANKIRNTWGNLTVCLDADSMESAVKLAFEISNSGDTVLLSPGCASFDMFDNYEHRGKVFKSAVMNLAAKNN